MPTVPIIPRYKLLLIYDVKPGMSNLYYRYVVNEFVPALNDMGLYVTEAWHTAYGDYPIRQVEYVADSMTTITNTFHSERWRTLEDRLKAFTVRYERKVIPYKRGFQF